MNKDRDIDEKLKKARNTEESFQDFLHFLAFIAGIAAIATNGTFAFYLFLPICIGLTYYTARRTGTVNGRREMLDETLKLFKKLKTKNDEREEI